MQVSSATVEVKSGHALLEVLSFAAGQRVTCSTLKNMDSSRSHAFYRLYMKPKGAVCHQHVIVLQKGQFGHWHNRCCNLQGLHCSFRHDLQRSKAADMQAAHV